MFILCWAFACAVQVPWAVQVPRGKAHIGTACSSLHLQGVQLHTYMLSQWQVLLLQDTQWQVLLLQDTQLRQGQAKPYTAPASLCFLTYQDSSRCSGGGSERDVY